MQQGHSGDEGEVEASLSALARLAPSEVAIVKHALDVDFHGVVTCRTMHELASVFGVPTVLLDEAVSLFAGPQVLADAEATVARERTSVVGSSVAARRAISVVAALNEAPDVREIAIRAMAVLAGVASPDTNVPLPAICGILGMVKAAATLSTTVEIMVPSQAGRPTLQRVPKPMSRIAFDICRELDAVDDARKVRSLCESFGLPCPLGAVPAANFRPPAALRDGEGSFVVSGDTLSNASIISTGDAFAGGGGRLSMSFSSSGPDAQSPGPSACVAVTERDFEAWLDTDQPLKARDDPYSHQFRLSSVSSSGASSGSDSAAMHRNGSAAMVRTTSAWSTLGADWRAQQLQQGSHPHAVITETRRNARIRGADDLEDSVVEGASSPASPRGVANVQGSLLDVDGPSPRRPGSVVAALRTRLGSVSFNAAEMLVPGARVSRHLQDLMRAPLPGPHHASTEKRSGSKQPPSRELVADPRDGLGKQYRNAYRAPLPPRAIEVSIDALAARRDSLSAVSRLSTSSAPSPLVPARRPSRGDAADVVARLGNGHVLDAGAHLVQLRRQLTSLKRDATELRNRKRRNV